MLGNLLLKYQLSRMKSGDIVVFSFLPFVAWQKWRNKKKQWVFIKLTTNNFGVTHKPILNENTLKQMLSVTDFYDSAIFIPVRGHLYKQFLREKRILDILGGNHES